MVEANSCTKKEEINADNIAPNLTEGWTSRRSG